MDLAMVDKLASENNGIKYLLVSIDVLSRFVRVQTMTDKTARSAKNAFSQMMLKDSVQPKKVWTDQGTEFEGDFGKLCKNLGIHRYHSFSDTKAAYAERAIRSLKNLLYRYMENSDTHKYISKLQNLVKTMNSRVNRSIKMAPKDVQNRDALRIINSLPMRKEKPSFHVGDYVRIAKKNEAFRKGYKPQFTRDIYKVKAVTTTNPVTYNLTDKNNKRIFGRFYENELIHYAV